MTTHKADSLSGAEAARLREIMASKGVDEAAKLVGLCDRRTLVKAAFGESISLLTARVVRSALAKGSEQ